MHSALKWSAVVLPSLLLAASLVACSSDDGKPTQTGTSSGAVAGEDAGTGSEGGTAAAKKKAAETCAAADECESGVCFIGGNQSFCSVKCTTDTAATICVAPFTGTCNKQGYCKRD